MGQEILLEVLQRLTQLQEEIGRLIQRVSEELTIDSESSAEEKQLLEVLSLSIKSLELNRRAFGVLRADGIAYIGELVQRSQRDMLKNPGLGIKTMMHINEALASKGLTLGMNLKHWSPPEGKI